LDRARVIFTLRLARAVEPDGVVYALDANRRTVDELRSAAEEREITTLQAVVVPRDRLDVPGPVDLVFVSATYHHLPRQTQYFAPARTQLRPGGRVAILESRPDGVLARWLAPHATDPRTVRREMEEAGYRLVATHDVVRGYWFGIFEAD
jgi:predicted methyltransferase